MKPFFYPLILTVCCSFGTFAYSQNFDSWAGEFYSIQNKGNNEFLSSKKNLNVPRISYSKFSKNIVDDLKFGIYSKTHEDKTVFVIKPNNDSGRNYYLSILPIELTKKEKYEEPITGDGRLPRVDISSSLPDGDLVASDEHRKAQPKSYNNYKVSLDKIFQSSKSHLAGNYYLATEPDYQYWEFLQVNGESDTYYIFNTGLKSDTTFLTLKAKGSKFVLAIDGFYGGNNQKWIILPRKIKPAIEVTVSNFILYDGYITGIVEWKDNSNKEDSYKIKMAREDNSYKYDQIGQTEADYESIQFKLRSGYGRNKKHCFYVQASSQWDKSNSEEDCRIPIYRESNNPPPSGYKTITVYNCHEKNKKIYVWSFNNTTGEKINHGILDRGNTTASSPCGRDKPLVVNLKDGNTYTVYTYEEPNEQCLLGQSPSLKGGSNGGNWELIINTKCRL
ncbi:MAG: hypothetical protein ACKV1O_11885 [Saprospiraceae bacterium]